MTAVTPACAPVIDSILPDSALRALLAQAGLPTADLSWRTRLFGIHDVGRLVACVGLEPYGEVGLLRSLAVAPDYRGKGLGQALVRHAEHEARSAGIDTVCLLTTTAAGFFGARDYAVTDRADAPAAIRDTLQFSSLCPASSSFMCKRLSAAPEVQQQ